MLQVGLIDFDVNFLNFEDPEVLAKLTGDDYESHWIQVINVTVCDIHRKDVVKVFILLSFL